MEPVDELPKVAFIGLGRMGSGMVKRIQEAHFPITVYNRTIEKTAPFAARGAKVAQTPRQAAAAADILVTSLLDDHSILDMMVGTDGILEGLSQNAIHLGTTTISPEASNRLAEQHREHGSRYVAANVLGRPDAAEVGQLTALVAGEPEAIERSRLVLKTFTVMIVEVGNNPANAARMKLIINFFLSGVIEAMGEAYLFAEKHKLSTEIVRKLIVDQVLPNPALREYAERIKNHRYDKAGATLSTAVKDLQLILKEAASVNAPIPIADLVRNHILTAMAHGHANLDWCVSTEANRLAGGLGEKMDRED